MTINSLPPEIYTKIAAGEVVANPACALKELVENSIDAGATQITVRFENGGIDSLVVKDNGSGMSEEDAEKSFLPHTTSKITKWEDLLNLETFGFRGEALSAISAVSEMTLLTKTCTDSLATRLYIRGGNILEKKRVPFHQGTEIEVRNLFFNVPARRKFLKAASTESRKMIELLENFLIAYPAIRFRIEKDTELLYEVEQNQLADRLLSLFQGIPKEDWFFFEDAFQGLSAGIYIAKLQYHRKNRTGMHTFVNGRIIKNPVFYASIDAVFEPVLGKRNFPLLILFLHTPKDFTDVNVHPQKLEVSFARSEWVYHLLQKVFQKARSSMIPEIPIYANSEIPQEPQAIIHPRIENQHPSPFSSVSLPTGSSERSVPTDNSKTVANLFLKREYDTRTATDPMAETSIHVVGIVNQRYLIGEDAEGVLFIDFHAAHEKILFEKILENRGNIPAQDLLQAIPLKLNLTQMEVWKEQNKQLQMLGFRYEQIGDSGKLLSIPSKVPVYEASTVFLQVLEEFRLSSLERSDHITDHVYASIACKQAFKTGENFTVQNGIDLLKEMEKRHITTCPHGRPVQFRLTFKELDRYFKR